jgi:hypothetical protein
MRLEAFDCIYVVSGGVGGYSIFVSKGHWGEKGEDTGGGHGVGRFAQGFEIQREYWEVGGGVGGGGGSRRSRWE